MQDAFNEEMQSRLARSVWDAGGCGSWYLDANGRDSTMWPGFTFEFRKRTRAFDLDSYVEPPVASSTRRGDPGGVVEHRDVTQAG